MKLSEFFNPFDIVIDDDVEGKITTQEEKAFYQDFGSVSFWHGLNPYEVGNVVIEKKIKGPFTLVGAIKLFFKKDLIDTKYAPITSVIEGDELTICFKKPYMKIIEDGIHYKVIISQQKIISKQKISP